MCILSTTASVDSLISLYVFDAQIDEHTFNILKDEVQHSFEGPNNFLIEVIEPVKSIEASGAHVILPKPLLVRLFDKNSKHSYLQ